MPRCPSPNARLFSRLMPVLALSLSLITVTPVLAQSTGVGPDVEPDVTIRQQEERTIEEYRVNGQLYAIKITPKVGPSYYLVDEDGDGNFARQAGDEIAIPRWVLVEW